MSEASGDTAFSAAFSWNLLGRISQTVTSLGTSILLARGLGSNSYGMYASILAVTGLLPFLMEFGYESILNVKIPQYLLNPGGRSKAAGLLRRLLRRRAATAVVVAGAFFFLAPWIANWMHQPAAVFFLRICALNIFFESCSGLLLMFHRAALNQRDVTTIQLTQAVLFPAMTIFAFLIFGVGLGVVMAAQLLASAVALVFVLYSLRDELSSAGTAEVFCDDSGSLGFNAWLSNLFGFILGKEVDILILGFLGISASMIGQYNLAFSLAASLGFLSFGIGPLAQSVLASSFGREGLHGLGVSFNFLTRLTNLMILPVFIFVFAHADSIIRVLYGSQYLQAGACVRGFVLCRLVYLLLGTSFAIPTFYVLRLHRMVPALCVLMGILNILLDFLFIPSYGALGAVFGTGLALVATSVVQMAILIAKAGVNLIPIKFELQLLAMLGVAILPTLLLPSADRLDWLILKGLVYLGAFSAIAIVIKPLEAADAEFYTAVHPRLKGVVLFLTAFQPIQ